jgi:hypothetical protein
MRSSNNLLCFLDGGISLSPTSSVQLSKAGRSFATLDRVGERRGLEYFASCGHILGPCDSLFFPSGVHALLEPSQVKKQPCPTDRVHIALNGEGPEVQSWYMVYPELRLMIDCREI